MINSTVMRAGRNALIGAMLCTTAALAVGTIATSTPDELRTAALVAASTQTGSPYALTPGLIDHLSTGAPATGPVKFQKVGNVVDTGATDLGGPNGAYLAELRAAGLNVDDAVGAMRLGRDAIHSIKHNDDPASAYGEAYAATSVALSDPAAAPVSGGGARFMARQVIAAAVHSFSPDVTGILAESGVTV